MGSTSMSGTNKNVATWSTSISGKVKLCCYGTANSSLIKLFENDRLSPHFPENVLSENKLRSGRSSLNVMVEKSSASGTFAEFAEKVKAVKWLGPLDEDAKDEKAALRCRVVELGERGKG